jgi:hypothetical protein
MQNLELNKARRFGVVAIQEKFDSYTKKTGNGGVVWCHLLHLADPDSVGLEPVNAQLCIEQERVTLFGVNDIIEAIPKNFSKGNYTISFTRLLEKGGFGQRIQSQVQMAEDKARPYLDSFGKTVITGSAAERAMSYAVHLHQMRPSNTDEVLKDADKIFGWMMAKYDLGKS